MRVAIVSGNDCEQLSAELAAQGDDVTAYVRRQDRRPAHMTTARNCRRVAVRAGPPAELPAAEVLPFVGDWAAELEGRWSSDRPDIVHPYGWLGGLAAQLAARRTRATGGSNEEIEALTDTVIHSVTGFVVPPNKPRELVAALKPFQGQPFQCESMGAAGRSRAMSRFTWDRIARDARGICHQANSEPHPDKAACRNSRPAAPAV
ncbi:glycosyltransferase [Mycobacterium lacus]|uniref:Glycosyltransferase subfamily 4-like N-terminal domain-containing protein n=1 Tax=Mycobacterium lacus TaxID=169765 RepID=A0A7I7NRJ5_9MYCO|nr:glycosyltransferase [Mycobacterium lacus]MCV7123479.1 hypothetical protein [Mycobacterium lacus]BBX99305.1 hypothetical protein MLAC_45990 [Mycobacterium lacus]